MYLRLSPYQEILQGILTDLEVNEGIIKVTGKSGAGKTALCAQLCHELQDGGQPVVLFFKPPANAIELQNEVLARLGLDASGNFTRTLTTYLIRQANPKPLVLIFDDAHLLDQQTLSAIRMLCNIQNRSRALIRVILCGDEELDTKLATPALRAVAQFLSQSISLPYLSREQIVDFCQAYWQALNIDMKALGEKEQQKLYQETQGHPGILQARLNQGTTGTEKTERGKADASAEENVRSPMKYAGQRPGWIPGLLVILALILLSGIGAWLYFTSPSASNGIAVGTPGVVPASSNAVETSPADAAVETPAANVPVEAIAPAPLAVVEEPAAPESVAADLTLETPAELDEAIAADDSAKSELTADGPVAAAELLGTDAAEAAPATLEASPAPQPPQPEVTVASPPVSVEAFLMDWAQSWQSRDVDAYLAKYHESFAPPQGLTRSAWEEQRRSVIGNAQDLVITIDPPELNTEAQDGMRFVRFWLNYRAANYADRTLKEVLLVPVDGTWRIRAENNLRTERQ